MPAIQVQCPNCNGYSTYVIATNSTDKGIIRRRKCTSCNCRWYTIQPHELQVSAHDIITVNKKPQLRHDPL
jgi:transcriptional regulator NrdR family protein